jgi:hypothetical protein
MSRTIALLLLCALATEACVQSSPAGRWDLTVTEGSTTWPMWLEISEGTPFTGRLQGRSGHALALHDLMVEGATLSFPMPGGAPEAEAPAFSAVVTGDELQGELIRPDGTRLVIHGVRAPSLSRTGEPDWGEEMDLLAGGLDGWSGRSADNGWALEAGELVNLPPSSDLITREKFSDFKLHLEVNVPPAGNSGIYLRGRHEVQVQDDFGKPPYDRGMGGIYGQVSPTTQPTLPPGEWQVFDITLVGRYVTVVLNGVTMIDQAEIPGITGGALDSDEGAPGPIMLQGDHSGIRYRNIRITPARP